MGVISFRILVITPVPSCRGGDQFSHFGYNAGTELSWDKPKGSMACAVRYDVGTDLRVDMRVDIRIDIRTGMYTDMCIGRGSTLKYQPPSTAQ